MSLMETAFSAPSTARESIFSAIFPAEGEYVSQPFATLDVRSALTAVLASPEFCRSQRSSRLLQFLVDKAMLGAVKETNEYAIGIEVFDRDPSRYDTCNDPIVRVQIGRLREKLRAYYAAAGERLDLQITIPVGSYMPTIKKMTAEEPRHLHSCLLSLVPLLHLSQDQQSAAFTQGLNEELTFQLFKEFGHKIVSHTFPVLQGGKTGSVRHFLEGSTRINGDLIRISLRLVDASTGVITWSEQFDRGGSFVIALQEELALRICHGLKSYFSFG